MDDYAPWRRFIIAKFRERQNLRIVGVAPDGLEAILKAEELQPDLILLDIGLPKINGIVAARRIREVAPQSKILFVSETIDMDVARAALSEGGHGFVVKSDAEKELIAAVEAVIRGEKFVSRRLASLPLTDNVVTKTDGPHSGDDAFALPAAPLLLRREVARRHGVQFYSDNSLLIDGFISFLCAALKGGNPAVFIGTASHRNTLLQRLQAEGPDIRTAIREGKYIELDAVEFLSNFMMNDMPDSGWFLKVVDDLIVAARKGTKGEHLRVAACGECPSMLWAQGKADAAIRLEELWNEIAKTYDVDILCGYPLESLRQEEDSYTFRRICEEHSAVRG